MIHKPITQRWRIGLGVAAFVLLAMLYTLLSSHPLIPNWAELYRGLVKVCTPDSSGEIWLWVDGKATIWRIIFGLTISLLIAIPLGVVMGCYTPVGAFFQPPLLFFAKIPATAILIVFFIMIAHDYQLYPAIIAFGVTPTLALTVYITAKEDVPDELINKAYTLGASQLEVIWEVIYKYILPKTLDAMRLQIGPAIVYLIAAELLVGDVGLGCRLRIQSRILDMPTIFIYVVSLGLVGLSVDYFLIWLRRKLCPWYER